MAHATMWVKLILPWPLAWRCLLRRRRFSSTVRTGIVRTEVAVGTVSEASMFSTMRMAPPRMGWRMSPGRIEVRATALEWPAAGVTGTSRRARVWCSSPDPEAVSPRLSVGRSSDRAGAVGSRSGASLTMTVTAGASGSGVTPSATSK